MRKHTIFEPCDRHVGWYATERRYRRAEVMAEGGWANSPCQPGQRCQMKPGTDFFTVDFIRDNPVYQVENKPDEVSVWIAEATPDDMYGVYSTPEKAKAACKKVAEDYFGPNGTKPLIWKDDGDDYSYAAYSDPRGNYTFHVIKHIVDANEERGRW